MKIYVCIKQIPNIKNIKIDQKNGCLIRNNVANEINEADRNALEFALCLKDKNKDIKITAISMGPLQAKESLKEALSMGADKAVIISDALFAGSDTYITSKIISKAINYLGIPDLILLGKQASDGETGQVGPQLAEKLNINYETSVFKIKEKNNSFLIMKEDENCIIKETIKKPCLLTINKESNLPRNMKTQLICSLENKSIEVLDHKKLKINKNECGLEGSPTKVKNTFVFDKKENCVFIEKDTVKNCVKLIKSL